MRIGRTFETGIGALRHIDRGQKYVEVYPDGTCRREITLMLGLPAKYKTYSQHAPPMGEQSPVMVEVSVLNMVLDQNAWIRLEVFER
jgi:hypothetical protein